MFDLDLNSKKEMTIAKDILNKIKSESYSITIKNLKEWEKFSNLVWDISQISNVKYTLFMNEGQRILYKNKTFIITSDRFNFRIYRIYRGLFKSVKLEINYPDIENVDYSKIPEYEALFLELKEFYLLKVNSEIYKVQLESEFKKLINFV
jgi:hypothetical protein